MNNDKELNHGSDSTYCNHGCRCVKCKQAHRDRRISQATNLKSLMQSKRKFIQDFKINKGCMDCGYKKDPVALDFDHMDPTTKLFSIAAGKNLSINRIKEEMTKCEVVCANCHRIRTKDRQNSIWEKKDLI